MLIHRNAVAYGDNGRIQVKGDYDTSLICSLLQTIYSSNITTIADEIIDKIKHKDKESYSKVTTGLKAILSAGDYMLSTEWAHKKYGLAPDNLETYINKFSNSYKPLLL